MQKKHVQTIRKIYIFFCLLFSPVIVYGLVRFMGEVWLIVPGIGYRVLLEVVAISSVVNIVAGPFLWIRSVWRDEGGLSTLQALSLTLWVLNITCLLPFAYYRNIVKFYQFISALT